VSNQPRPAAPERGDLLSRDLPGAGRSQRQPGDALAAQRPALEPTRPAGATLAELLEVLLNKGVYLDLDLIISVADIPLIGVNLRATIAGIETMLEFGMMRQWDSDTRAWVQKSLTKGLSLRDDEEAIASMAGGYHHPGPPALWHPGRVYLTSQRLIVHRREPEETLWEAELSAIAHVRTVEERPAHGEALTRVEVTCAASGKALFTASQPERLVGLLAEHPHITVVDEPAPDGDRAGSTGEGPAASSPETSSEDRQLEEGDYGAQR
jgi:hypothetical protein